MSKADEKFRKLGYKKIDLYNGCHIIEYKKEYTLIGFEINTRNIIVSDIINIEELQAINEKCKELRWIE